MGLLAIGTPFSWAESSEYREQVKNLGIKQLIDIWKSYRDNKRDVLLWGDETEYMVVVFDDDNKTATLSLRQAEILDALKKFRTTDEAKALTNGNPVPTYHPEFGRFMLEATPGEPYGVCWSSLLAVEDDMRRRRKIARMRMGANETPISIPSFPRLGTPGRFTTPYHAPTGERSRSQFLPDEVINPHVRFPTLAANIRSRRGRKVAMNVPVFYDTNTPRPFNDPTVDYDRHLYPEDDDVRNGAVKEGHIYMDAMGFGMGCCCLQLTFQAKNINEARMLYDQLCPMGPIMLALTAASPIFKGFLAEQDVRWNVISGAVDDRTPEELGEKPLRDNMRRIQKSRYDSVSTYIADDVRLRPEYNDPDLVINEDVKKTLMENGMDELLARHFAHLFIRDPLVIFQETLIASPEGGADHFENIQSTNWQHMRFKPPPPGESIGWRVEFRSMEIQITDFENAAFSVFIVLLTRAILSFGINLYIPIQKVDENMKTAHARNAVLDRKFHFRKDVLPHRSRTPPRDKHGRLSRPGSPKLTETPPPVEDEYEPMTVDEIINGKSGKDGAEFIGLIPLIESYLNAVNVDVQTRCDLAKYLDLVSKRASGKLQTGAAWIRDQVRSHPDYQFDSVVSERINYDLLKKVEALGNAEGKLGELGAGLLD